ncbi:antibiotic biosynthesis monooxygenase family protein [Pseudomonas sp. UBA7530]|uniref:antibiotic biosynthesis monooxygenase family protein n=1 Tax=Pseudomonas sp. UBA7530 TaxID=1947341 RepID=UPI0025FB2CA9|nr:antibiotic biosynthesis monooxygenase [Pseudomonas sp. UBA7530]
MVHEIALLPIRDGHIEAFRRAFADVTHLLQRAKGYDGHMLAQGIESPQIFNLIVRWQTLEDHTPRFEASEDHRLFMMGLEHCFAAEPQVYHIQALDQSGAFDLAMPAP